MASDLDYSRRNKSPRPLTDNEKARLEEFIDAIHYSARQVTSLQNENNNWNPANCIQIL